MKVKIPVFLTLFLLSAMEVYAKGMGGTPHTRPLISSDMIFAFFVGFGVGALVIVCFYTFFLLGKSKKV
jgi:hypothetical protein